MRKIWLVLKREYLTRIRTKVFILSTVGLPLFSIGIFAFTMALAETKSDHPIRIAVIDNLGGMTTPLFDGLTEKLPDGQARFQIAGEWDQPASLESLRLDLASEVRDGSLDAYLEIPKGILDGEESTLHTRSGGDYDLARSINRALSSAVVARRLGNLGVRLEDSEKVLSGVKIASMQVTKSGESRDDGQSLLFQLSIVMVLYITLLVYGVMTMRSVLEEKTTRVIEILASSIKPLHLLTGKILGVAAVGATQYLIWMTTAALVSAYGSAVGAAVRPGMSIRNLHIPAAYLIYPVIFFLAGYFLYASIYAAVGSMVSSEEELQQVQMPVTIAIVGCFVLYPIIQHAPNSPLAVALTLFPLSSPILMVYRITVQTPPFWQIALSLFICGVTTLGVIWIAARIYRVGILMYGKRPSLVELLRWLRYT